MARKRWAGYLVAAVVAAGIGQSVTLGQQAPATHPAAGTGAQAECEKIDVLLRAAKWAEAAKGAETVIAEKPGDEYVGMAQYQLGVAKFMQRDLLGAGRELAKLAPFDQSYGGHARYLLGRVHDLMNERPEAEADYHAVYQGWLAKNAGKSAGSPENHATDIPDYVLRAAFYEGVIMGDEGKIDAAIERLKVFSGDAKSSQRAEATLRIGLLQLKAKQYGPAIATLRALETDARFGDQASWYIGRALVAGPAADDSLKRAAEELKQAAEKAGTLAAGGDAEARLRRADELLELGDAQMAMKMFADAAETYNTVLAESGQGALGDEMGQRVQEGMTRQAAALEVAGKYDECERLVGEFEKRWPKSLLMGSVLFRGAESVYLRGAHGEVSPPLLEEAIKKLSRVVEGYPQFDQVNAARQEWGSALYQLGRYSEAAEVLKNIPEAERRGDLATVSLMEGDCLLRTMPAEGDDAVSTARMLRQAELAAKQFASFVGANPKHPETLAANFKLGYCYQKMAGSLKDGTWWDSANKSRDCYDQVLGAVKPGDPLLPAATLERAKIALLLGDPGAAEAQLKKFRDAPLSKSDLAPVGLLKLATMWQTVDRAQEGADLLAKIRDQKDAHLAAMMEYEYGVCLKDAGKADDARKVFEGLAAKAPESVEGQNSLWKQAQMGREPLASALGGAQRRFTTSKGKAHDAAEKQLTDATDALRKWADAWAPRNVTGPVVAQGAVRLKYEVAWGYRQIAKVTGQQADYAKAEQAYREAIAAGQQGTGIEIDAMNVAWMDLGEMLAEEGRMDDAMDAFTGALDTGGEPWVMGRAQVRIAECLLAKGDNWGAIHEAQAVSRSAGRLMGQARYVIGEAYWQLKDTKHAMETLRVFEDPSNYLYAKEVADKALLRLGDVLMARRERAEAATAYQTILKTFPLSPLVAEAREKMMDAKYAWGGLVFRMQ